MSNVPPVRFLWGGRFGCDLEGDRSEDLPSQKCILAYVDEVTAKLEDWLRRTELTAPEERHPYTRSTVLGRTLYVLRHTRARQRELTLELGRRGYPAAARL